ncbi:MAG: alpha/beta hydrolase, partial [Acidimicrobiales bacterium]
AYVVALLAGLDPGFEAVVAGIPVVDLPTLFAAHSPVPIRRLADRHGILGTGPEVAHHVVSPLAFNTTIAHDRRFIFAGYGDRMAFPSQAVSLWEHWSRPAICWYPGSHVGYLWSRPVARFLDRSLTTAGLTERAWAE